jgi:hypothetical protein
VCGAKKRAGEGGGVHSWKFNAIEKKAERGQIYCNRKKKVQSSLTVVVATFLSRQLVKENSESSDGEKHRV